MAYQATFKRYELKYLLTAQQKEAVWEAMEPYMKLDEYGRTTIRNIYYDTPNYRLIRRSLEQPAYKEKLRVRSYQRVWPDDKVFVELKKKYDSVVYKRRLTMSEGEVMRCMESGEPFAVRPRTGDMQQGVQDLPGAHTLQQDKQYILHGLSNVHTTDQDEQCMSQGLSGAQLMQQGMSQGVPGTQGERHKKYFSQQQQIADEINYFREFYKNLVPAVFLSYEREAYYALNGSDFRVTFDEDILYREDDCSLESEIYGSPILGSGQTLMEIKTSGGIPMWMTDVMTERHIYRTSFSKYGSAYCDLMNDRKQGGLHYA